MQFESFCGNPFDYSDLRISGLAVDSRKIKAGDLFIARKGVLDDGHKYVEDAIKRGAIAVVSERPLAIRVPNFVDPNLVSKISGLADEFYKSPSSQLRCIGVTGTNGKTSIAYFCSHLIDDCGFIGSIGWGIRGHLSPTKLTTPDAVTVQEHLANFRDLGMKAAAIEVSSHALSQDRVSRVHFDTAIFSNLTREHLDYHGSIDEYRRAKKKLFTYPHLKLAVINRDDLFGRELLAYLERQSIPSLSYGNKGADICWENINFQKHGITGKWKTPWGSANFFLPLYGHFSIFNAAAALAAVLYGGSDFLSTVDSMRSIPSVPGRMQIIRRKRRPTVIIDYAHTPDGISAALEAVRVHNEGRLFCVFGCGGDRDTGKRPLMAREAEKLADNIYVTSDNPRSEDPEKIISEIVAGFSGKKHRVFSDRKDAIQAAIDQAVEGDVVLIAGKGSENFQELQGRRIPFNDMDTTINVLEEKSQAPPDGSHAQ